MGERFILSEELRRNYKKRQHENDAQDYEQRNGFRKAFRD